MGHRKKTSKRSRAKTTLRLPDLEQSKNAVLNSLAAASSQESYGYAIDEFNSSVGTVPSRAWPSNRTVVLRYRFFSNKSTSRPRQSVFASIAEFERELIRDRVKSGLALAKSRGKCLGRPRVNVDRLRIAMLRNDGRSWAEICDVLGISKGTAQRAVLSLPKNLLEPVPASR